MDRKFIGQILRRRREELGLQSKFVAYSAHLDPSSYCCIEKGKINYSVDILNRILDVLDYRMCFVCFRESIPKFSDNDFDFYICD